MNIYYIFYSRLEITSDLTLFGAILYKQKNVHKLVKELNIVWQGIWVYLTANNEIEGKKKKDYMVYTLYYSDLKDIKDMNIENCITTYISSNENFLDIDNPDIDKIIDILFL